MITTLSANMLMALTVCWTLLAPAQAGNPILPGTAFIPDGEPRVFEYNGEQRVFLYGSKDERITTYCGPRHDVWSAPVRDLTRWTNHGEIFHVKQVQDAGYGLVPNQHFGAPDCVYNPVTRKYYLYTFFGTGFKLDGQQGPARGSPKYVQGINNPGLKCFRAVSKTPIGPFVDPVLCDWPPSNSVGTFDPAVLVDEQKDGSVRVYAYWGMKRGDRWAEIDPTDMHTIINPQTRKSDRNAFQKTLPEPEQLNGSSLFEASSIRKVAEGKYVFICSANERNCALTYYYGNSPAGPWSYGGRIIDNGVGWRGGNNHGSIAQIEGKWYVFYHRPTCNSFNRKAMVEPIDLRIEGGKVIIPTVEMTSQGTETGGLDAFRRYNVQSFCYSNGAFIDGAGRSPDGLNPLVGIDRPNRVVGVKYLNFGSKPIQDTDRLQIRLNIRLLRKTSVSVQVAQPREANDASKRITLATLKLDKLVPADNKYHDITAPIVGFDGNRQLTTIGGLAGKLAFFLRFDGTGGELCRVKEFELAKGDAPTPNPLREIGVSPADAPHGVVTAIPTRARTGESVKLSVVPDDGYQFKSIKVNCAGTGAEITIQPNGLAPYAPRSFNFEMPAEAVRVSAVFQALQPQQGGLEQ